VSPFLRIAAAFALVAMPGCESLSDLSSTESDAGSSGGNVEDTGAIGEALSVRADESTADVFPGEAVVVGIEIIRGAAFAGAVTLTVDTPPAGVKVAGALVASSVTRAELTFEAAPNAVFGTSEIVVNAASADGQHRAQTKLSLRIVARPGTLDTSFGSGGSVITAAAPNGQDFANGMTIQPDGKILVVGTTQTGAALPAGYDMLVLRYDANGVLDATFGDNGKVVLAPSTKEDYANGVVVLPDGKIVVAGHSMFASDLDIVLVKLLENGTKDASFGTNGVARLAVATSHEYSLGLGVQSDGKLVVFGEGDVGTALSQDFLVARFLSDGKPDNSFDGDGRATMAMGTGEDWGVSGVIQPDGKLVVAGSDASNGFAIARWTTNGQPDASFGTGGKVLTPIGGNSEGEAMALQTDGKIVMVGGSRASNNVPYSTTLVRYLADGKLDPSFGKDGILVETTIGACYAWSVQVQSDGKIVVLGEVYDPGTSSDNFAVWRYLPNGDRDPTFGTNGLVISTVVPGNDNAYTSVLQADGKILGAGRAAGTNGYDVAVARYWP
jgi:uncharacterized delta-60 repeat protein